MMGQEAATPASVAPEARVLVVDPDAEQRRHIGKILRRAGFRTTAVPSGEEALEAVRRERPALVVLEVRLEDTSGYEVCRALREEFGGALGIMFVSADRTEPLDCSAGLAVGADDYLGKPLHADELMARVRALARRADTNDHLKAPALRAGLTERELEVLRLLADGLDQHAIASRLVVSHATVGKHIEHILAKLPARSRAEAVAIAWKRGLRAPTKPAGAAP
jgi:DNA-binding NarL/FixJ family response regulator